jgi:cytochrome c oxidase subunit IV
MSIGPEINPRRARTLPFVVAWLILLVLGGVSLWVAFLSLGMWTPTAQFGIAALQTTVMFVLFMRLKEPPSLKWVFGISGFFWLLFLFGLSMTDYSNRQGWPTMYYPNGPSYQVQQAPSPHNANSR